MKKSYIVIATLLVLSGAVLAVTLQSRSSNSNDSDAMNMPAARQEVAPAKEAVAQNKVSIRDYAFDPVAITVKAGTKVTWTNKDNVRHDITSDGSGDNGPQSKLLGQGDTYSYTFTRPGTYTYHCSPHPYMKGTVIVTE